MSHDWTKLQSQTIDWLRFPMAVAVVMLHYGVTVMDGASGVLRALCIFFQEGVCRLAVPCFFFISAYLFFNKLQQWSWSEWKRKIKSRCRTLLIPYLLWNVIAFFAFWAYARIQGEGLSLAQHFRDCGGFRLFWGVKGGLPLGVHASPIDSPLWFIRDLIFYTLLTPAIYLVLKWTRVYGALLLGVFFVFVPGIIPEGFVFYVAGACFRLSNKNMTEFFCSRKQLFYVTAAIALVALCLLFDSEYWRRLFKNIFLFSGIGAAFCLVAGWIRQGKTRVHPFLSGSSFFIFAAHEVLILNNIAQPLTMRMLPFSGPWRDCLAFFLVPAVAVAICLGLLFVMERLLPRTTAVLTGNRKAPIVLNT